MQKINPCLWFDHNAEEAVNRYVSIFKNSKILGVSRYGKAGKEIHGRPAGSVMTAAFKLDGQAVYRAQRRPGFQIQRGGLVPSQLRDPGRSGLLLGAAIAGRR